MIIELHGVGFVNKGAELMLHAMVEKIRKRYPESQLVMAPTLSEVSYSDRTKLGLLQKFYVPQLFFLPWHAMGRLIPKRIRQAFGLVGEHEIDVFLDASGFLLGDSFRTYGNFRMAVAVTRAQRRGGQVILLPQAFGPFNQRIKQLIFSYIAKRSDLVFARDRISFDYATKHMSQPDELFLAPDFTCLLKGEFPEVYQRFAGRFCVIPNCRMLDKTDRKQGASYVPFLILAVTYLQQQGARPFFLVHEGDADYQIARQICNSLEHSVEIIQVSSPKVIKGIIGESQGILSSRYHGLVSALSQGVPALATGWSHKYQMLFEDYGFPQGILSLSAPWQDTAKKIDQLLKKDSAAELSGRLSERACCIVQQSEEMWERVFELFPAVHGSSGLM